jgi:hypothetical protein
MPVTARILFEGVGADDATGRLFRAGGDADADGLPDLLVGAANASAPAAGP